MRRLLALLGFVLVIALVSALLWRVWLHHHQAAPFVDEPAVVLLDAVAPASVIFAQHIP